MEQEIEETVGLLSTANRFIEANTVESSFQEITEKHVIPVFTKSNEPLISHSDFIGLILDVIKEIYPREVITDPAIRISHPIQGRIPAAKSKLAKDLLDHEKTLYYERLAFMVEIPTIYDTVGGNQLSLTVGAVNAYNLTNYNSNRKDQHFKAFIGFKNTVCTNLCINTDGLKADICVRTLQELKYSIKEMIEGYNAAQHIESLRRFSPFELTEAQVSHLIGRLKMFNYLPVNQQRTIHDLRLTDSQLSKVVQGYFNDPNFKGNGSGGTNLWHLYNNLTGALKSAYIDQFLEKTSNAQHFMQNLASTLAGNDTTSSWYLN